MENYSEYKIKLREFSKVFETPGFFINFNLRIICPHSGQKIISLFIYLFTNIWINFYFLSFDTYGKLNIFEVSSLVTWVTQ